MITINQEIYQSIGQMLISEIGDKEYYNGKIEYGNQELYSTLRLTVMIYRDKTVIQRPITDIIPIWWEFHPIQECGEVDSDFSWSELKTYLLPKISDRD